jgi:predicted enzyme related to lactoylglutathione lyase
MTNLPGSFIWYELMSPDPDASKTFYDAVVGWDIGLRPDGPVDYRMIRRADGGNAGGLLGLTPDMMAQGARPTWLAYLNVENVDASADAIAADGGHVLKAPETFDAIGRIAMLTDPQGNPFFLIQPQPPAGAVDAASDVFSEHKIGHVAWNELATPDPAAALAFYNKHFGIFELGRMPMGDMGDYQFLGHGSSRVGALMRQQPDQPAGWMVVFRVASAGQAAETIVAQSGAIVSAPQQVPGDDWVVVATDPHGIRFGVVGGQ